MIGRRIDQAKLLRLAAAGFDLFNTRYPMRPEALERAIGFLSGNIRRSCILTSSRSSLRVFVVEECPDNEFCLH